MLHRQIQDKLLLYASQFRAVAITGARQTGKTTLCKMLFNNKPYVNFENLDVLNQSQSDPRGFLQKYQENGAVFDEIQKAPVLFNYLQEILDNQIEKGKFILTGSGNFLLNQSISQSLAGRVGFLEILPLSLEEIPEAGSDTWKLIYTGGYPEIWAQDIIPSLYYQSYIQSFIEKDIRQLINIKNLSLYQQFIKLVAARTGQELNHSHLAMELGVDSKTISQWVSFLQVAGVIFLLQPYYANLGKRIIKRPKLYFYDTGLVCSLLGIQNQNHLDNHPLKGVLFENFVIAELIKQNSFLNEQSAFYYWRSISGVEIDLIIEKNARLTSVEIKSGMTYHSSWWKMSQKFNTYSDAITGNVIVFNGNEQLEFSDGRRLINIKNIKSLLI
jgi:uncharacterized protein